MRRKPIAIAAGVLLALGGLAGGIYWNEARKEVIYLCGNFTEGVTLDSVRRQLDTGTFLRYAEHPTVGGRRIVVDSRLTRGFYTCVIDMDKSGRVIRARSSHTP